MASFFLVCAIFGGGALLLQVALGLFGLEADHDIGNAGLEHAELNYTGDAHVGDADSGDAGASAGLNLLSVRALTAGIAFFGLSGLAALRAGWPSLLALLAATLPAVLAVIVVAYLMRSMLRLQSDGSLRLSNAIGSAATVYIPIPAAEAGLGRITLSLQSRTVECEAITRGDALPTGTEVTVVDVRDGNLLEVVPTPNPLA
jgi:membrane protein implicated in regulation of membrane protease activity